MKYKGYQSKRHYHNAKIHAMAIIIAGEDYAKEFLQGELEKICHNTSTRVPAQTSLPVSPGNPARGNPVRYSVKKDLTDLQAATLYNQLLPVAQKAASNEKMTKRLLHQYEGMTDAQRKQIIRLTKYKFKWSPQATFSHILQIVPECRRRLSPYEISRSDLTKLYSFLSTQQASKIIKRLMKIERRNNQDDRK